MLLLLATAAVWHRTQGLDTSITYRTRAARAAAVLPELGRLAGVDLQASAQTANEILVISVKDQPLSEILPRIATVTSGEWRHEGDTIRLVPNRALRNREDAEEAATRVAIVKKAIDQRIENSNNLEKDLAINKTGPDEIGQFKLTAIEAKLSAELLGGLDPAILASTDDRMVFSTNPNSRQRPLGPNASVQIEAFIAEYNKTLPRVMARRQSDEAPVDAQKPIGQAAKAILIKHKTPKRFTENTVRFSVIFYDAAGKVVYSDIDNVLNYFEFVEDAEIPKAPAPIDFSRPSRELMKAIAKGPNNSGYYGIEPELWQMLMRPLQFDPLSFQQTDKVFARAKEAGKPLVADIPDDWNIAGPSRDGEPTEANSNGSFIVRNSGEILVDELVAGGSEDDEFINSVDDGKFTVVKPARPSLSREIRIDRQSYARLVYATATKGLPSADDLSAFASANLAIGDNPLFSQILPIVAPNLSGRNDQWLAYRFLADVSPDQRTVSDNELKIGLDQLSRRQRAIVEQIVYGNDDGLMVISDTETPVIEIGGSPEDYRSEPTEAVPNGLPATGSITLVSSEELFASRVEESGLQGVFSSNDLAQTIYARSQPSDQNNPTPPPGKLRMGKYVIHSFTLSVLPNVQLDWSVCDYRIDKSSKTYTEADLPADFLKDVQERLTSMRTDLQGSTDTKQVIPP